ncbi:MAG: peptidase, partial [Oceanicaulis sp.]|nr:peptidase [Oceanicaulis sp.]
PPPPGPAPPGRPVVFRTLDLGGDKVTPYTRAMREPNPALGWRGLRMGLDRPGLTRYQLRALVRAASGRELNVLFPMITETREFERARAMLDSELRHAERHGHTPPTSVRAGFMLETPAIAFAPQACLEMADFVSVGANDLMQYFFAADRQNPRVAGRYDPVSTPALGLLRTVREACARAGKPVNVCGEMAGRPLEACVLTALGYRGLSMAAGAIGPVKRALAGLDAARLAAWLDDAIAQGRPDLRRALLDEWENAGLPKEAVDEFTSI